MLPHVARFIADHFGAITPDSQVKQLLDQYFVSLFAETKINADGRLYEALEIILKKQGIITVETGLDTGISSRQLRRLFEFYIGDTPKTFSKIVRFQNLLHGKPSARALRKNKLFLDAGYYDQAHFIKEFKTLFGSTPVQALRNDPVTSLPSPNKHIVRFLQCYRSGIIEFCIHKDGCYEMHILFDRRHVIIFLLLYTNTFIHPKKGIK